MEGRRLRTAVGIALTLATALLASCGGGGGGSGGGGGPTITGNFFPLDSDGRWFYAAAGAGSTAVRVVGPATAAGVSGTLVETVDEATGSVIDQAVYAVAADGVRQYSLSVSDPITAALNGLPVLRYPLQSGDSYVLFDGTIDLGDDLDGDGRNERLALRVETTVVGVETVTTAAGVFTGALHQHQVIRQTVNPTGGSATVSATITLDTWYGRDVGPVQTRVRVVAPGVDETVTDGLTAYGVGGSRSETVAPTVQATTPGPAPVRSLNATVSAEFSEAIDPASIGAATLTVRDAAGAPVAGSVSLQGTTARFTPALPWASGTYTATVDGARDRVGNPLAAPRSWTFVVDETAPGVVASTPAMGAADVAIGTNIVVDFSEEIEPTLVVSANVLLIDDLGAIPPIDLAMSAGRLTVTPAGPLLQGRTYQLRLRHFADRLGNPMPDFVLSFRTSQGRFSYPSSLIPGAWGLANAIGDINGDGIADVLVSTQASAPAPYQSGLFALAGRGDGTFGAPQRLDIGLQFAACPALAIVIGDLDGDGRADVAIGSPGCGIQVLRQSAAGVLAPAEHLPTTRSGRLRLADLDNDGKLDLVGVGGDDGIGIWKRGAGGALAESGTFMSGSFNVIDIDVGDLNGDGRPDMALALSSGQLGKDLAVVYQQANGSFAGSVILSAGSTYGSARVAIGDLNGDGRADLIATAVDRVIGYYQGPGGAFEPMLTLPTLVSANYLEIADMDNDGKADLVVGHLTESRVGVYYQRPGGGLSGEELYAAPALEVSALQPLALGDVTGDGRRDIVASGSLLRQHPNGGLAAMSSAERKPALAARAHPGRLIRDALSGGRAAATLTR